MELILFRHGIAVERDEWDGPDEQRPLTHRGAEKTREAIEGLLRLDVAPTHLLASPLVRAQETAGLAREILRIRPESQIHEELLPGMPPDKLIPVLHLLPSDASVLCVGHEPHLGQAAGLMLFGDPVEGLSLKKAGACCIRFDGAPRAGTGQLRWWLTPAQLRSLGKS